MGKKPAIDPKYLPTWFRVKEYTRSNGATYKTYKDTWNNKSYRSLEAVARDFGLGGNSPPCIKPLNMRKGEGGSSYISGKKGEDGSSESTPMLPYTTIPAIPEYVAKDIGSDDSSNLEEEEEKTNTTSDVPGIMKEEKEKEKENEETGHAASNFEKEEEIAKKTHAPSADAATMKEN